MRTLARKATFLGVVAAVVGVTVGSLVLSQDVTFGAETDGSETDVSVAVPDPTNEQFPQPGGSPAASDGGEDVAPPAAPVDDGNDGAVGANTLPSAGNGGYLGSSSSNTLAYALMAFAVAIVMTGSVAWVSSRK